MADEIATFCKAHRGQLDERLILLSLDWPSALDPRGSAELTAAELAPLRSFNCRDALCFKASDRGAVLKAVYEEYGSAEAFDQFVRTELPPILAECKRQYRSLLPRVILRNLLLVLGDD